MNPSNNTFITTLSSTSNTLSKQPKMTSTRQQEKNIAFFSFHIINPEMSLEDLASIIRMSILRKWNSAKVEEINPTLNRIVVGFPFMIRAETIASCIADLFNFDIANYVELRRFDFISPEMKAEAKTLNAKYSSKDVVVICTTCNENFKSNKELKNHEKTRLHLLKTIFKQQENAPDEDFFVLTGKSAFRNRVSTIIFLNKEPELMIEHFFEKIIERFTAHLESCLNTIASIKVNCNLFAWYKKVSGEEQLFNLNTSNVTFFMNDEISQKIKDQIFPQVDKQNDELNKGGSGWIFNSISELEVRVSKSDPMKSAGVFIDTPNELKLKKTIINIKNYDEKCFYYCILAKFQKIRSNLVESYKHTEKRIMKRYDLQFNFDCLNYPTTLSHIKRFEQSNRNVSINVFIYERKKIAPIKVCDVEKKYHYDLLMLKKSGKFHYTYIKNFSRLISSQIQKCHGAIVVCKKCLTHFYGKHRQEKLANHKEFCGQKRSSPSRYELPTPDNNKLYFKDYHLETPITYCVFADFEAMLVPTTTSGDDEQQQFLSTLPKSKIHKYQKHEPIAFSFYLVHSDVFGIKDTGEVRLPKKPVCYVGKNAATIFFEMLKEIALKVERNYKKYLKVPKYCHTADEMDRFNNDPNCCICRHPFELNEKRVWHHSHITSIFIGPAHNKCNLKARVPDFLPVFFHNLSKYDGHLILHGYKGGATNMKVIPNTEESYISFSKRVNDNFWIRFVDSYQFLSSSLRVLVDNLPNSQLVHTQAYFSDPQQFELITQKGFFCYDYLDDEEKLQQREIPKREDFYNELNDEHIDDKDYEFVRKVWHCFKCRNLEDYLTIYVISDCLLLADVFLSFRKVCLENYGIDPCYFYSLPGYSFNAMLKLTETEFDLITDYDQYLFLESGLRGGINNTVVRYAEANNVHVPEMYDLDKPFNSIFYIDVNNLYGFAMLQKLPVRNFSWLSDDEIGNFSVDYIGNLDDDGDVGYYLEVDLDYPAKLHDLHNAFPFAPERKPPPNSKTTKLLCTLENKRNYVCHFRNLKLCLKHGLVLRKIHRILKFDQENFLKPYIDVNTGLRQRATNDFDKSLFKLMVNSCFGKFIENQRNYMNFKLVCTERQLKTSIAKPSFKNSVIFSENLVGIHFHKSRIMLNKPIYVGITICELARNYMYYFYYEKLGEIFVGLPFPQLLYMDTDSFMLSVQTNDIYPYIQKSLQYFDTSNYPSDHICYSNANNKIPGYFKDELIPVQCERYISLCPKVYSLKLFNKIIKKIKGVKKGIVKKEICFEDFHKCLFQNVSVDKEQKLFTSKCHEIYTVKQIKRALSNFCDKRYFYDNIDSLAYGHCDLELYQLIAADDDDEEEMD